MSDQIPQLPVPSAEEIKKFKAKVPSGGVSAGVGLPIPSYDDVKKFKTAVVEKKKPTEFPSTLEKPAVSSVAGLRPMVSSQVSKPVEAKPTAQLAAPKPSPVAKPEIRKSPVAKTAPAQQSSMSVTGSQGKLLIPEPIQKVPAVVSEEITYKNVPVVKVNKNLTLKPDLMLKAIARNEGGTIGQRTNIKGKGITNSASGTYQMTDGTVRGVYENDPELKKGFKDYNSFRKEFDTNPSLEFKTALSHMTNLVKQFGKYAFAGWYSPSHAAQAKAGNLSVLKQIPRRDAGNTLSIGKYQNNAMSYYNKINKEDTGKQEFTKVPVSKKVVTEKSIEVPSLEKFNVLNPNWYGGPVTKTKEPAAPKKFGALEDIGNTFMSSVNRFASGVAGLPNMAQKAALMMTTKMLGIDDEYNALPVAAKKEIDNVMSEIAKGSSLPPANVSLQAQEYFIKNSDEFLENTNKSDKFINERFGDFFSDPSVDKATDLFLEIPKGFAGSLPYMINPLLGAVSSASEQYNKDIQESGGKLGWGQLANAGITGVSEFYIEKLTRGILNRSIRDAIGMPKLAKELADGFVKSVLKDMGMEGAGEAATELVQSLSDDITKGREIDWTALANRVIDAGIIGTGIAGGMRTTGAGVGYLAKKVMPKSDKNIVDRNTRAIMDLNSKKGPDNSPEVNTVIENKINDLNNANIDIINNSVNKAKSLPDDQLVEIVKIDNDINNIAKQRDEIVANQNLTDEEKQSLLDYLRTQNTTLNQQKDAIQKQATSEVPVQPEAGTGLQVAEGEPQAEPQVPTQEDQGQEVVDITANIPKQDLPKVMDLVSKIEKGEKVSSPEDLQTQQNYAKEVESLLAKRAADAKTVKYSFDINTPTKFNESEMPEVAVDNIDWEASGMGNVYDAIDSYGGINDITVVDVRGKNADGLYEAKVRVRGQDVSREGVVVLKDPNAPQKPRMARQRRVSPEFTATEKVLSDNGVYPSFENVEAIVELSKAKPGAITQEDIQGVVKVYNKKAKAIADAFNKQVSEPTQKQQVPQVVTAEQPTAEQTIEEDKQKIKSTFPDTKVDIVTYHDSDAGDIDQFRQDTNGIWTTGVSNWWQKKKYKYKVALDIRNPKIISDPLNSSSTIDFFADPKNAEYDAIVTTGIDGDMNKAVYVVRNSSQTKILGKVQEKQAPATPTQTTSAVQMAPEGIPSQSNPAEQPSTEEQPVEEPKQIKVADAETIAKEMQTTFGLNKTQSKAAAVVIDKIAGTMAKRAGTTKSKIMDAIVFKKGDINELTGDFLLQADTKITQKEVHEANNKLNKDLGNLAPNGKPSNLTPSQYAQVRTPEFKEWFGDWENDPENASKIVDDNGEPMVVYTGTSKDLDFKSFKVPDNGAWFTVDPSIASQYAVENDSMGYKRDGWDYVKKNTSPRVLPVFLDIKNPVDFKTTEIITPEEREKLRWASNYKSVQKKLFNKIFFDKSLDERKAGIFNDGIYYEPGVIVVTHLPSQIKSAIGNKGTFSKEKDNILFQKAYHGGAVKFNKFSTGKVGTGNKSRFGGWGLYFTLDKARANTYANQLKNDDIEIGDFKIVKSDYRYNDLKKIFEKTNSVIGVAKELLKLSELNKQKATKALNDEFDGKYKESEAEYEKASLNVLDGVDVENSKKIIKDFQDRYEYAENGPYGMYSQDSYEYRKLARTALSEGAKLNNQPAYTYEVSIADDLNLLDFNETISEDNYNRILTQAIKEGSKFVPGILKNKKSSGKDFYFNVSQDPDYYDNEEEFSLLMLRSGIDGNTMRSQGTQDIILFDENAVEINDIIQFQQSAQGAKGAMQLASDGSAIIYALTDPDVSTPLHEMAHVYENYLTDAERKTVLDWAGKKDWDMPVSEKFARGFEKYLAEGKSPNKELTKIFESFKKWLLNIYNGIVGSEIDIKLNDDMRKIYDTMLSEGEEANIKDLPGYARMMGEIDGIVDKSFNRGVSYMQTMDNAIKYMEKSKVYEDATDTQREAMVREVRKMFKQKEKKAPTAQKILGQKTTKTTITIDESKELNKRLKALEAAEETGRKQGYKKGTAESDKVKKEVLDYVKSLKVNNKISGSQFKAINNALKGNLRNPVIRKRVEDRINKIISRANAADLLERAKAIRASIKTAAKSKTLAPNIAKMAKNFGRINPSSVPNVEEYMDMANVVYDSIGRPIRNIASVDMVNAYTDSRLKEAQDAKNNALMDQYNALVEAGVLSEGMSLKDIQDYILSVEQNKLEEVKEEKEREIRDRLNEVFDSLSDIASTMIDEGVNPFTGDEVDISAEDKAMLKEFINMDLNKLPIASAYRAQEALMNYIVNGKKFGMQAILAKYQGQENVKIANNKGLKAGDFRWIFGGSWWGSRKWGSDAEQIRGLFNWIWRGKNRGLEMMKLMGVEEFMDGSAKAKEKRIKAEQEYVDKFIKTKPNGKRFNSIINTYERLVYGYLSRTVDGTAEEKQTEFKRRQRILGQVVQALEQSRNKDLIEEGKVLSKEFDKVKDANTVADIQNKFDKINKDAVLFVSNMFDQDYEFIEGIAEGVYNLLLSKDELYTPDMLRDIKDRDINVTEAKDTVDLPYDLLNKKPAGTMMKNSRIENLPGYDIKNNDASEVSKILKLDFDASVFNAYEKALVDAYTANAVQKYSAFVNSKDFSKLFDSATDQALVKEILNFYINNERGKIAYKSDWKDFQRFSDKLKTYSTYRALGSATAIVKQSTSAIVNTTFNLSNDPNALNEARKVLFPNFTSKDAIENAIDAQEFINKYGGEINLRGPESTADIKSAERLIRESKNKIYQSASDVLDIIGKLGRLQMKSLSKGDVPPARASWIGYYVHSLKKQGKPYKNIDWKTEKPNKEAISYANNEVSISQSASMSSTLGKAFTSKNPLTRIFMAYVMPYTSFLFNAKSRLKTDITVLTSKLSTTEDKQAAARSIVATLAELPFYIAVQTGINYGLVELAHAFLGYDEDEEDEKLRRKRYTELAITRIITDLLSPAPNVGDVATVAMLNSLLENMQEEPDMTSEEKKDMFKLFENKPESLASAMVELLAQPVSSTVRRTSDIYTTLDMINGDYYITDSGKEIEFSNEDKKMLQIAATMQIMGSLNLLPSEAESLAKKMVKTIEKRAKEPAM